MEEVRCVAGAVAAVRTVGRSIAFVDLEVASEHAQCEAAARLHGLALPAFAACTAEGVQPSPQQREGSEGSERGEGAKVQLMLRREAAAREDAAAALLWKQLLVGSVWTAVGRPTTTSRGGVSVEVQQLFLVRCRMDPAPLTRLLDAAPRSQLFKEIAAQAIFGAACEETVRRVEKMYAEYAEEAAAGRAARHVSQLARFLSTGQHRRRRKRATHVPLWMQSFVQCEASRRLTATHPLHQYSGEGSAHRELTDMCMENHECIDVEDDHDRMAYLSSKKKPQVAMMLDLLARTLRHWHKGVDPKAEMSFDEVTEYCSSPFLCLDVGCGRGDLALNIATICRNAEVHVCDLNQPSLDACRTRAEELNISIAHRMHYYNVAAQELFDPRSSTFLEEVARRRQALDAQSASWSNREAPVVVVGLHACGGLSDVIMQNGARLGWPFICCTCCFASHPHLRDWEAHQAGHVQEMYEDLAPLAENNYADIQPATMHLLNSLRAELYSSRTARNENDEGSELRVPRMIESVHEAWKKSQGGLAEDDDSACRVHDELHDDQSPEQKQARALQIVVWQFPAAWSGRNLVVQGVLGTSH